jgi:hypothetical protein
LTATTRNLTHICEAWNGKENKHRPLDESMFLSVLDTVAAFRSIMNSKPSALTSFTVSDLLTVMFSPSHFFFIRFKVSDTHPANPPTPTTLQLEYSSCPDHHKSHSPQLIALLAGLLPLSRFRETEGILKDEEVSPRHSLPPRRARPSAPHRASQPHYLQRRSWPLISFGNVWVQLWERVNGSVGVRTWLQVSPNPAHMQVQ